MKDYKLSKSMMYQLIIVCFLYLCFPGCDNNNCLILVDPDVLDFGETEDELESTLITDESCGWCINYSKKFGDEVIPSPSCGRGTEIISIEIDRQIFDLGEHSGTLAVVNPVSGETFATITVIFTIPGDDDTTTTTTTIPVSTSTTTDPITTSTTTTSVFKGDPPIIHYISFPSEIIADGESNSGTVRFSDPDGDIVRAYFKPVSGYSFTPFDFDPMESLKEGGDATDGEFGFSIWCTGATRDFELKVYLKDEPGNESNYETFGFTCVEE